CEHISRGHLDEWLKKNGQYELCLEVAEISRKCKGERDLTLISLARRYLKGTGFVIRGKLITFQNLYLFAIRCLKKEASPGEHHIISMVMSGNLKSYYEDYLASLGKKPDSDSFYQLLSVLRFNVPKVTFESSLQQMIRVFDFWWHTGDFFFHKSFGLREKIMFLTRYGDRLLKKSYLQELKNEYLIPLELEEMLCSRDLENVAEAVLTLLKWEREKVLIKNSAHASQVYLITDYLRQARTKRLKVDPVLTGKIPWLSKKLPRPVMKRLEIDLLESYLFAIQNGEVPWNEKDRDILHQLCAEAERTDDLKHFLISIAAGTLLGVVVGGIQFLLIYLIGAADAALYVQPRGVLYSLDIYFGLLALGAGAITGWIMALDAREGGKMHALQRGFWIGCLITLVIQFFFHIGYYYLNFGGAVMFGIALGTIASPYVKRILRERRYASIVERFLPRITAVNQNIIEVKEE
ncbi:MAG: hypothetical protein PHQ23_01685, partial [Candidatus Wallbacteria bacterium]|nr:hypothetical protein [Candidatus Wallbacteria bacterium]